MYQGKRTKIIDIYAIKICMTLSSPTSKPVSVGPLFLADPAVDLLKG